MELKEWMQQAFNKAYLGLIAQGHRSWENGGCKYRCEDGSRCAVGMLIPDRYELEDIEENNIQSLLEDTEKRLIVSEMIELPEELLEQETYATIEFLRQMQRAHDDGSSADDSQTWLHRFRIKMVAVASEYELELPEVPNEVNLHST
jgi:hypothetical protein